MNPFRNTIDRLYRAPAGKGVIASLATGSGWMFGGFACEQGLRFLRNMVLARLLAPHAFGVMAILQAAQMLLQALTETGVKQAVVQHAEGDSRTYLNAVWLLSVGRGVLMAAAAWIAAPWVATYYAEPELVWYLRVIFLGVILDGAASPAIFAALKHLEYRRWVMSITAGGIIGVLLTVALAQRWPGVWALILGSLLEALFRNVLSYLVCPFLPSPHILRRQVVDLLKYCRGVLGLSLLHFVFMRIDILVVGKLCSMALLGIYNMSLSLAQLPFMLVESTLQQVVMPVFAKVQNDLLRLRRMALFLAVAVVGLCLPVLVFTGFAGEWMLTTAFGGAYRPAAWPMTLAMAAAIVRVAVSPMMIVYFSIGRPHLHRVYEVVRVSTMLAVIMPAVSRFQVVGAAAAGLLAMLVASVSQLLVFRQTTGLPFCRTAWRLALFAGGVAIPGLLVGFACRAALPEGELALVVSGCVGLLLGWAMACLGLWLWLRAEGCSLRDLRPGHE